MRIIIPLGEEDGVPENFPFLVDGTWCVMVHLDSGRIVDWPAGYEFNLSAKVCDQGRYQLLNPTLGVLSEIAEDYVPHDVIPGEYGDSISLGIAGDGTIRNWPHKPNVSRFFR